MGSGRGEPAGKMKTKEDWEPVCVKVRAGVMNTWTPPPGSSSGGMSRKNGSEEVGGHPPIIPSTWMKMIQHLSLITFHIQQKGFKQQVWTVRRWRHRGVLTRSAST